MTAAVQIKNSSKTGSATNKTAPVATAQVKAAVADKKEVKSESKPKEQPQPVKAAATTAPKAVTQTSPAAASKDAKKPQEIKVVAAAEDKKK